MTPRARARLVSILVVVAGLGLAVGFALYGLSGKITYFHSPTEIMSGQLGEKQFTRQIRVGGLVRQGSLLREGELYTFMITDNESDLVVTYRGVMPDLFREGQSVIAYGKYDPAQMIFVADEILAKHDENYMPPEVKKMLDGETVNTYQDKK